MSSRNPVVMAAVLASLCCGSATHLCGGPAFASEAAGPERSKLAVTRLPDFITKIDPIDSFARQAEMLAAPKE